LKVNKQPYPLTTSSAKTFVDYLNNIQAHHFTMYSGLQRLEFTRFIALLTSTIDELKEKGGFYEAINSEGFKCIKAVKVFIQEVTEEETVVSKREMEKKLEEQRLQAEMDVLAMLEGNESADIERMAASAHIMAQDSAKMAGMIVEAAAKQQVAVGGQQSKSSSLVTCLRRAFNGLMKDPAMETQKGKKALMKTLRELEKEIHIQMGDLPDEAEKSAITEAIETMEDEIKMDAIAAEYAKRLKAIEQSEKRILRFIKAQGLDNIDDSELALRLSEAGLDVSGWHALLAKSKASASDRDITESEGSTMSAIGNLAAMLSQLQDDVKTTETVESDAEETSRQFSDHLAKVDQEVKAIAVETEHKIQDLAKDLAAEAEAAKTEETEQAISHRLTRNKLLRTLAEIVQELCQPLSVVNCSINMVTSNALGEVPKAQIDILKLAEENTHRIERLMRALKDISGMPDGLRPDAKLQNAINNV
ncbi:MAG: hypothetical protein JXN60_06710, partial [Lentisphaerae bacterium]|nr:hypothetical protein [Lentisphaerota bacterium]